MLTSNKKIIFKSPDNVITHPLVIILIVSGAISTVSILTKKVFYFLLFFLYIFLVSFLAFFMYQTVISYLYKTILSDKLDVKISAVHRLARLASKLI